MTTTLFTDHDKYHIHKVLGFGCLSHYAYRFYMKLAYGSMFFEAPVLYIAPAVHLSLSLSSFLFHVPKYRFQSKAIIWRELQLHNIIFTSRSVCMMYHAMFFKEMNAMFYYSRLGIVLMHHYIADLVSEKYKHEDKTTTRDIPFDTDSKLIPYIAKKYYAFSQVIAMCAMLMSENYEHGLMIMFPIQLSAFLMTLVRKNIISNNVFHIIYALSLGVPYILNINNIGAHNIKFWPSILCAFARLGLNTNKYLNMIVLSVAYARLATA